MTSSCKSRKLITFALLQGRGDIEGLSKEMGKIAINCDVVWCDVRKKKFRFQIPENFALSFPLRHNPEKAIPLYDYFCEQLQYVSEIKVQTGKFGADMKVSLVNDGPVTIVIDSKNRE